jgi:hypothetical protein
MSLVKRSAALILPALLLGPLLVRAQGSPPAESPKFFGSFSSTVGAWAEYEVTEKESGKKSTMRNAIVGKEGDSFWYEVVLTEGGVRNIIKMFLKGNPNNPENIQRLIMKNGDEPAQEMPREFVLLGRRMATSMFETRSGLAGAGASVKVVEVGAREVKVPAGTFKTMQNQLVDASGKVLADYDYDQNVLPLGVVRSDTEKVKTELVAYGKEAVSLCTEEPVMMTTPPGMPGSNPRGKPPGMMAPAAAPASGGYGSPAPAPAAPAAGGYGK